MGMNIYERAQKSTLLQRLGEEPQRLIIVTGPRQTGKTTLVQQVLDGTYLPSRYLPVDEPDRGTLPPVHGVEADTTTFPGQAAVPFAGERDTRWLVRHWERARMDAGRSERGFVLAIDEIQKIPNWSETVKGLWDADRRHSRPLHVILLGSAPLLMQKGMSESLAGRYETIRLTHWSFAEMSAAFDFDLAHYIYFGGYPGAASLVRDHSRWREYIVGSLIEPNIERDILAMQRVDKPVLLKRLFELGAEYSGQILSYNKMLGQLQDAGNTTTLARYLDLLSDAGLITGLSGYARGAHATQGFESETQRAQHRAHVVSDWLYVRGGASRPELLGASGRKRGRRASVQHETTRRPPSFLARQKPRGRFRPGARPKARRF